MTVLDALHEGNDWRDVFCNDAVGIMGISELARGPLKPQVGQHPADSALTLPGSPDRSHVAPAYGRCGGH